MMKRELRRASRIHFRSNGFSVSTQGVRNQPLFACPCTLGAEAAEKDMFKLSLGTSGTGSSRGRKMRTRTMMALE